MANLKDTSKTAGKQEKKFRPKKAELFMAIAAAINRKGPSALEKQFPRKYHVVCDEAEARRVLLELDDEIVKYVDESAVTADILYYCQYHLAEKDEYTEFIVKVAAEAKDFWKSITKPIAEEPPPFRQKSDRGLCFTRLPWDYEYGPTPLFDEFLGRCSDPSAVMAFVGSLFVVQSDRQQYLFLHGDGMNGKSTIIRLLGRIFGPAFIAVEPPDKKSGDKFWLNRLIGKRLVAFPDCNDREWITSQKFKMLTGNDSISNEIKWGGVTTTLLKCKFIFCSNSKPDISGQKSDMRRILFSEVSPIPCDPNVEYEEKLWLEAPKIVTKCLQEYGTNNKGGQIIGKTDAIDEIVSEGEEIYQAIFDKYFDLPIYDKNQPVGEHPYVTASEFVNRFLKDKIERKLPEFRKWLSRKYEVKSKSHRPSGFAKKFKAYVGISLKKEYF